MSAIGDDPAAAPALRGSRASLSRRRRRVSSSRLRRSCPPRSLGRSALTMCAPAPYRIIAASGATSTHRRPGREPRARSGVGRVPAHADRRNRRVRRSRSTRCAPGSRSSRRRDVLLVTVVEYGDATMVSGTGMAGGVMTEGEFEELDRTRLAEAERAAALGRRGARARRDAQTAVLRGDAGARAVRPRRRDAAHARSSSGPAVGAASSARCSAPCPITSCATRRAPS